MAKLTISDAARVAGVARSTLHRGIRQGRLSVDPDGRIDTAELLRAGYTLQRSVQQEKPVALQDATPRSTVAQQSHSPAEIQPVLVLQQERDLLRLERDLLRRELDAAHGREQAALERERAARERESLLLHMLEQVQQQNQPLLEAPQSTPPAARHHTPRRRSETSREAPPEEPRGDMRRRILALLWDHPEGLTPAEMRALLGVDKSLADTCLGMLRYGLVQRVGRGRYVGAELSRNDQP
jgi:hypothetical protein